MKKVIVLLKNNYNKQKNKEKKLAKNECYENRHDNTKRIKESPKVTHQR